MAWWRFGRTEKAPSAEALSAEERTALRALVAAAKYELIPLKNVRDEAALLPPGAVATVTASPRHGIETTLEVSEYVAARGHDVIPHFSARMIRDRTHLSELLARARAANIRKVFVVGGDADQAGEFGNGLDLLRAMHEVGHPFAEIGVPSYPEGHASIPDDVLMRLLKEKQQYAQTTTTQMAFNPQAVAEWIARIRAEGVTLPVHLGTPGVLEMTKLLRIAAQIGVADSARYLQKNTGLIGALASPGSFGPDAFLQALAPAIADPAANIGGLHVFTMNAVGPTATWQQGMLDSLAG
jgi:methylenetetrahydrofolate reductase (NADPH)